MLRALQLSEVEEEVAEVVEEVKEVKESSDPLDEVRTLELLDGRSVDLLFRLSRQSWLLDLAATLALRHGGIEFAVKLILTRFHIGVKRIRGSRDIYDNCEYTASPNIVLKRIDNLVEDTIRTV